MCCGFFKCLNHADLYVLLVQDSNSRAVPYHSANFCSYSSLRSRFLFSCNVSPASFCIIIRRPPAGILKEEAEKSQVTQGTRNSNNLLASPKGACGGQPPDQWSITFPNTHIAQTKILYSTASLSSAVTQCSPFNNVF